MKKPLWITAAALVVSAALPAHGALNYYYWKAAAANNGLRNGSNYWTDAAMTISGTEEPRNINSNVILLDQSSQTSLVVNGSNDLFISGIELTTTASAFSVGSRTLYSYANADGNYHINIPGGSGSLAISNLRARGSGMLRNDSSAATGLNIGGANGLMSNPTSSGTYTLTFSGSGNTSLNYFTRRNTNTNIDFIKSGSGTMTISGSFATAATSSAVGFITGTATVNQGVLSVGVLADGGQASSLGGSTADAASLILNGGTLRYSGAATTTNRLFHAGAAGATLESSGTGAIAWTNTGALGLNSQAGPRTFTLGGTNADANTFSPVIIDDAGGETSLVKSGTGTWILNSSSTYTGDTTIQAGVLALGAADRIADASDLVLAGGTLGTGGFNETLGTLEMSGPSAIDFGAGASLLHFAASSTLNWTGTLLISGWSGDPAGGGTDRLLVGLDDTGLAPSQLAQIQFEGYGPGAVLLPDGEVVPVVPEPASAALLMLAGLAMIRRRR